MIKEKLLGEATTQKLRENRMIGIESIDSVCRMLQCQPGDIIEFQDEKKTED
jgi:putative transcriptional regulator